MQLDGALLSARHSHVGGAAEAGLGGKCFPGGKAPSLLERGR